MKARAKPLGMTEGEKKVWKMARLRHASIKPKIRERHKKVGVTLKTTQPQIQ